MLDQSATDESTSPIVTYVFEENVTDIEIVSSSRLSPPGSHVLKDHNYVSAFRSKQSMCKTTAITVKGKKSPFIYQVNWEKKPEAMYNTYVFDSFGARHEKLICWLYSTDGYSMRCRLCEKHGKRKNSNGLENLWCSTGYTTLKLDKIKQHRSSEVHRQAQELEIQNTSRSQPNWITTQTKERSKQREAMENLILTAIHTCQMDHSLNSFNSLCSLLEKSGVKLLPAEVGGVSYRNADAALTFLQNVSQYLHEELIEKIKRSPVLAWMMDESTSRTTQKSLIVYVRYLDNFMPTTSFYCLIDLEGDGTAQNILDSISCIWRKDDLNPVNSCWVASDNASTFTGIHNGVVEKLRRQLNAEWLESVPCAAHSFALVGSQAAYTRTDDGKMGPISPFIWKLESTISKIYNYFSRSSPRQNKLKYWQNFLDKPELRFKRLYDIRWSSIRDCLKPIVANVQPNSQALFVMLEEVSTDSAGSNFDREAAKELLKISLRDDFLFVVHFHHDLHECVLGEITKSLQADNLSYMEMTKLIQEKKELLRKWIEQKPPIWGPSLSDYLFVSKSRQYGLFTIELGDRKQLAQECYDHVERLLIEFDRRFAPCPLREHLTVLFDPDYLLQHKQDVDKLGYGRLSLNYVREKYKKLPSFDYNAVRTEWETLKISLADFLNSPMKRTRQEFWQTFILLKQTTNEQFTEEYKNILVLLSVYLISASNSAECERGFSAANRVQTNGRSRLMIETLEVLLNVRLLLTDDIRSNRCQYVVEKAFESWNDYEIHRRYTRTKLLIDIQDDYEPTRQTRPNARKRKLTTNAENEVKKKKTKAKAIKCANRCGQVIASDDPTQVNAIQCCHQNEYYSSVEEDCSRWLCNKCRIQLGVSTDSTKWFCEDCIDMHDTEGEDDDHF